MDRLSLRVRFRAFVRWGAWGMLLTAGLRAEPVVSPNPAWGAPVWSRLLPITLAFEDDGGTWMVRAQFEGDADPGWLIVDTGASVSAFAEELIPASMVRATLDGVKMGGVGSNLMDVRFQYRLDGLRVSGVTVSGWAVHGMSGAHFSKLGDRRVVGIFGQDVMKRYVVCVDPRRREVVLHDVAKAPAGAGVSWEPCESFGKLLAISLAVDGGRGRFIVDSGARVNMLFGRLARSIRAADRPVRPLKPMMLMGMGGAEPGQMTILHSLTVGAWTLKEPVIQISKRMGGAVDGIVGYPVVSRVRTWWDVSRQRFGVEPYPDGLEAVDDPYDYDRVELMSLMQGQGDPEAVLKVCRDLRKRYPDRVELVSQEMVMLQMLGRSNEAEALIRESTQRHPDNPLMWRAVANIRYQQGWWKDYLAATDQMMAHGRSDEPETLRYRVETLKVLTRWPEALKEAQRARRLFPWDRDIAFVLQSVYEHQQEWEPAIAIARDLLKTKDPTAYLHLIRVYVAANQADHAMETVEALRQFLGTLTDQEEASGMWRRITETLSTRPEFALVKRHPRFETSVTRPLNP